VTNRRVSIFIDGLVAGRRPPRFRAEAEDAEVLRMAIALRAARPGDDVPDADFVAELREKLVDQSNSLAASNVHPIRMRRARTALVAVAASVVLVGGTFFVTQAADHPSVTTSAVPVPHDKVLRTGTFETAGGSALGQIVVYRGHPSWVYMTVGLAKSDGTIMCQLQLDNGSIVAAGTIELHHGSGALAKTIRVDISRLRGAKLTTSTGAAVASATFT
jgi:hypothetical protein